jgi:hypothetical protein
MGVINETRNLLSHQISNKPLSGKNLGNGLKTIKFKEFGGASKTQKAFSVKNFSS